MSSNAERAPNAGAQAMAEEALLKEIGQRAPSPTQAVKVCQILGLATRENIRRVREIAKNKDEIASEAENKKEKEVKEMEVKWGDGHYDKEARTRIIRVFNRIETMIRKISPSNESLSFIQRPDETVFGNRGVLRVGRFVSGEEVNHFTVELNLSTNPASAFQSLKARKGLPYLKIHVRAKDYLNLVKKFARRYERIATPKGVVVLPVAVSILKEY